MGQTRNEVKRSAKEAGRADRSFDEIEENIERTRRQMSETVHRIQKKLSMDNIGKQVLAHFAEVVKESGTTMLKQIKKYPAPAAVITFGVGWMIYQVNSKEGSTNGRIRKKLTLSESIYSLRNRDLGIGDIEGVDPESYEEGIISSIDRDKKDWQSRSDERLENIKKKTGNMGSKMEDKTEDLKSKGTEKAKEWRSKAKEKGDEFSEKAKNMKQQVGEKAHQAAGVVMEQTQELSHRLKYSTDSVYYAMKENPLITGVLGVAVGALAGLLIPGSRRENKLMGMTRDQFLTKARERGGEAMDDARDLVRDIGDKAADEIEQRFSEDTQRGEGEQDAPRH